MSNIIPFEFNRQKVRVVEIDGEPWFVAKDVAEILGYSNPRKAVIDHCKKAAADGVTFRDSMGREQNYKIIPEADVYRLIMRSKMPQAEAFEELVVGKILPTIRKTGEYRAQPSQQVLDEKASREVRLQMREFAKFGKLMGLEGNQLALSVSKGVETVIGLNPMSAMGITHIEAPENENMVNVTDLGKRMGCTAREMNLKLTGLGLQVAYRDSKDTLRYELTNEGKAAGGKWHDAQKQQGGRPIRQLLWPSSLATMLLEPAQ